MTIDTVQSLREHLQTAIEIEHGTLPPYLCALYSIEEGCNREASEVIHSVFIEEMLHLTLAANLLNAIGGTPVLDAPHLLPAYPAFLPHSDCAVELSLQKFSPEAIELFMAIEKPGTHDCLPEDDSFETIGQFYDAIGEALARLSAKLGEQTLFCGEPARQVTDALYYGGSGRIIAVTDLESAKRALEEIVEQGEGIDHESIWDGDSDMFHPDRDEVAHYFRFSEIAHGRRFTLATHRSPDPRVSASPSTGTPCTTCGPTPPAATTPKAARSGPRWTPSTAPTEASWSCCRSASTAARTCWPSRPARCTRSRPKRSI